MTPQKLPLKPFVQGDRWSGIPRIIITVGPDGGPYTAPADPLEVVKMRFRNSAAETVVELSSADGEITINSAAGWDITVPEQIIPALTAGRWQWQMSFLSSAGAKPYTYLADEIIVAKRI